MSVAFTYYRILAYAIIIMQFCIHTYTHAYNISIKSILTFVTYFLETYFFRKLRENAEIECLNIYIISRTRACLMIYDEEVDNILQIKMLIR